MTFDARSIEWTFAAFRWWLENFGGFAEFAHTSLVTPTPEDFPVTDTNQEHELAEDYFEFVKEHARAPAWRFALEAVPSLDVGEILKGMPHGLTSQPVETEPPPEIDDGGDLVIPYDPKQLADPQGLVATFARGVSHYLFNSGSEDLPDPHVNRECYIDIGAVFLGFGVFLANTAFRSQQLESGVMIGWSYQRQGALSQADVSFALAVFASLLEFPDRDVLEHLNAGPRDLVKASLRELRRRGLGDLERLRTIASTRGAGPYRTAPR